MIHRLMRVNWRVYWTITAFVSDAVIILSSALFAAKIVHQDLTVSSSILYFVAPILMQSFITSQGVYRRIASLSWKFQTHTAIRAYAYCFVTLAALVLLFPSLHLSPARILIFLLVSPVLYVVAWWGLRTWMRRMQQAGFGRLKTLVVQSGADTREENARLRALAGLGYDVVEVLDEQPQVAAEGSIEGDNRIMQVVSQKSIEHIVIASNEFNGWFSDLEEVCRVNHVRMSVVSPDVDTLLTTTAIGDDTCLSLSFHEPREIHPRTQRVKRVFDIVMSSFLLLLCLPIFLLVAFAIKLESRGPVLFRQRRSLSDIADSFDFYKFRSMCTTAEEDKDDLRNQNETDGPLFKIRNDPRLTRVGKFIRRFSLDEIPQLINVLKGDMSLVGPRPLPISDFSYLKYQGSSGEYFRHRAKAKPGMTGLWQVSGRSSLGFREMVLLDFYYIDNQSFLFDIELLLQTLPAVLFGKGAY